MRPTARTVLTTLVLATAATRPRGARAQNLGHRIPGAVGITAGQQPPAGVYVADRLLLLRSRRVLDRHGAPIDIPGFEFDSLANVAGVAGVLALPRGGPYVSAALAFPLVRLSVNSARAEASVDRFGLGDLFVQPFKVGWRLPHLDVVGSYAVYIPTGLYEPRTQGSLGSGAWTHEFAAGGAVYFDRARTVWLTALASYYVSLPKREIDITRGDVLQVQGGAGVRLFRLLDVGLAAYALWQVRDDRGADVPQALRGARDRVYGLGPEVNVLVAPLRASVGVRYVRDIGVLSRPESQILVFNASWAAWQPAARRAR